MAILIFILSLILLVAAAASGYQSIDLLPTGIGVLYALAAAVAACAAVVTFAIGVLVRRIDGLAKLVAQSAEPPVLAAPLEVAPSTGTAAAALSAEPFGVETGVSESVDESPDILDEAFAGEDQSPINLNRAGRLPSLETLDTVLETPEEPQGPPSLIGSYSSAGANYRIFADGSIEAETSEGTFKFTSMNDFKRHLQERGKARVAPTSE